MKIENRKNRSKKPLIITAVALALIAGGFTVFALQEQSSAPAAQKANDDNETPREEEQPQEEPEVETPIPPQEETPESAPQDIDTSNFTLVTENEQFAIRKDTNSNTYQITLYAIINRPDQAEYYRDQLKEYKTNALNYLKNRDVNIESARIVYEPEEAASL